MTRTMTAMCTGSDRLKKLATYASNFNCKYVFFNYEVGIYLICEHFSTLRRKGQIKIDLCDMAKAV